MEKIVRSIPTKNHQIKQSDIRETGRFPVVSQSQALVEGFSNDKTKILENTDSLIIFGDHTRILKLIDFPFIIGADGGEPPLPTHTLRGRGFLGRVQTY